MKKKSSGYTDASRGTFMDSQSGLRTRIDGFAAAFACCFVLVLFGCSTGDDGDILDVSRKNNRLYIAGYYDSRACVWIVEGTARLRIDLPDMNFGSLANSVALDGNDIYVSGYVTDGGGFYLPCFWKNGLRIDLPMTALSTSQNGNAIFVERGKVYVAGSDYSGVAPRACIWVNGMRMNLEAAVSSMALSVTVDNGSVYASGYYYNGLVNVACVWVNGVRSNLPTPYANNSVARAIRVWNGAVWAGGFSQDAVNNHACVWVNGIASVLDSTTFDSTVCALDFSNGMIVPAGYRDTGMGYSSVLWAGLYPEIITLDSVLDSEVRDIKIRNGSLYMVGYDSYGGWRTAALWINGFKTYLDVDSTGNAAANSLAISY